MKFFHLTLLILAMLHVHNVNMNAQNIDSDIYMIRNNDFKNFNYNYDDYLQYSPGAVMLGMKLSGYESRTEWNRMIVSDLFSTIIMSGSVNLLKYTVSRIRPSKTTNNSWPSGHTATSFMAATMLHMEYGWRSPWWSIGGYTIATCTGLSRILNNDHWMSDIIGGAAIGIGSTYLGYFLSDLIFKDKGISPGYLKPDYFIDPEHKYYNAKLYFSRRFILDNKSLSGTPQRGSSGGLQVDVPLHPRWGLSARAAAGSLSFDDNSSYNIYNYLAGGWAGGMICRFMDIKAHLLGGYAHHKHGGGVDITAGGSLGIYTGNNFRLESFFEYELMHLDHKTPWLNSINVGFSAGFCL